VAVVAGAGDRDVEIAGRDRAAVDADPVADRGAGGGGAQAVGEALGVEARAQRGGGGGLLAIVEVDLGRAEDLVVLVALAGDHDDVARRGLGDRGPDRGPAIDVDVERVGHRGQDLIEDRARIFGARVIAGDHREIGLGRDHRAHLGALGRIAIAAAAEHADQPALGQRAQGVEDVVEGVGGVGVVDQEIEAGVVGDPLDPAGHARQRGDPGGDRGVGHAQGLADADRQRDVGDVVVAEERVGLDLELAARGGEPGPDPADRRALRGDPERGGGGRAPRIGGRRHVQDRMGAAGLGGGGHRDAGGIVDVGDRDAVGREVIAEQEPLGRGVVVHRAVQVEVVLGQVRERADRELDAGQALHRQGGR
jgi:hypothetical protein